MNNIWTIIKNELKEFFFNNRGKFYCIVVAVGAILVILTFVLNFPQINKKAKIELVDTNINEDGNSPAIDIKVRNSGDSVAYLYCAKVYLLDSFQMKEIYYEICDGLHNDIERMNDNHYEIKNEFDDYTSAESESDESLQNETELMDDEQDNDEIIIEEPEEIWDLDENETPLGAVDVSIDYPIVLSNEKEQEFNISQAVYPNDVDRFTITFLHDGEQMEVSSVNYLYIEIYYNKNDYISTPKMIIPVNVDDMSCIKNISEINLENVRDNYEILLKFNAYADAVRSEKYDMLLTSYENNKSDF